MPLAIPDILVGIHLGQPACTWSLLFSWTYPLTFPRSFNYMLLAILYILPMLFLTTWVDFDLQYFNITSKIYQSFKFIASYVFEIANTSFLQPKCTWRLLIYFNIPLNSFWKFQPNSLSCSWDITNPTFWQLGCKWCLFIYFCISINITRLRQGWVTVLLPVSVKKKKRKNILYTRHRFDACVPVMGLDDLYSYIRFINMPGVFHMDILNRSLNKYCRCALFIPRINTVSFD